MVVVFIIYPISRYINTIYAKQASVYTAPTILSEDSYQGDRQRITEN